MHQYDSVPTPLFQDRPRKYTPGDTHEDGWNTTIKGYKFEANRLSQDLVTNATRFTWFATVYLHEPQTSESIRVLWQKVSRHLRKHIVAVWIIEPTRRKVGHVHYHMLLTSEHTETQLHHIFSKAFCCKHHKKFKRVRPKTRKYLSRYFTKAHTSVWKDGQFIEDKFAGKRLLFRKEAKITKHGVVGDFWRFDRTKYWKAHADKNRRIKGNMTPAVQDKAAHLHTMFGGTISLAKLQRSVALWSDLPSWRQWLAQDEYVLSFGFQNL